MKHNYISFFSLAALILCSNVLMAQYCASNATNTGNSKIDAVQLVGETITINQNSAGATCETYTDNTALPAADLQMGSGYTTNITLGTCNNNQNKSASLYIDFNQDNDFDDPGEDLGNTGNSNATATIGITFTVPSSCMIGTTRMRVVLRQGNNAPSQCGTYNRGETEDYTVNIILGSSSQFYLVQDAVQLNPQCIQLTSNSNGQLGMAWDVSNPLNFATGFSYDFSVNFGNDDGGADGVMFIIQNDPNLQCVAPTGGWGAGNITNSLIIEMDTYLNTEDRDDGLPNVLCFGGPDPDHMDIWTNGNINPSGICGTAPGTRVIPAAIPTMFGGNPFNIENGLEHTLRVTWVAGAPGTFTASLLDAAGTINYATVSHSFDPITLFGTTTPIYGFSGSTGGLNNRQTFCSPIVLLGNQLVEFDAKLNASNEVELTWAAASHHHSDYFIIEKSTDQMDFQEIASMSTQGTIDQVNDYTSKDLTPSIGVNYYRIKMIGMDGSILYSTVKAIERQSNNKIISIYPNPVQDQLTIELAISSNIQIELHNQLGQQLHVSMTKVGNKSIVDLSSVAAGIYWLQIKSSNSIKKAYKIIKYSF